MKTMKKLLKNKILEYWLLGFKLLLGFFAMFIQSIFVYYVYFILDVVNSFREKRQEEKNRDLTTGNFEQLKKNMNKMAKSQQKSERDREIKENSLKLLNKLIAEGLIKEKDLLSLTGTSGYFQLFVYSASLSRLAKPLGLDTPKRQYPIFLEKLGFARLGKASTLFLINKSRLDDEKLKKIENLKKFLAHHFSKIRAKEWRDFLGQVKEVNKKELLRLSSKSYKEWGYLKYNFLLTETNMNPTNVGFVDNEYMGLGVVSKIEAINEQLLERVALGKVKANKQLKIKIRKIMEKMDISLLLDGIVKADRDEVDLKQDIIKENLGVENVIDFYKVNVADLASELVGIGLDKKKSNKIAKQIIKTTKVYKNALTELNITI